jgi:hypothetical protein
MNKEFENEYDEALKLWSKAAINLRSLDERAVQAEQTGTVYYLTDDDGELLSQERNASIGLEKARQKLFKQTN